MLKYYKSGLQIYSLVLIFFLNSCEEKPKLDTKEIVREVKNRTIKRVTPSEIIEKVNSEGEQVVINIEKSWLGALNNGLEGKGKEYAKKFCIVPFIPGYDTIASYGVKVKKLGTSALKHSEKLEAFEKQILEAYQYNVEHKLPLEPNIQKSGDAYLLYTSPIFAKDKICLQCHSGNQGFTDFKEGDFAGMWSVKLLKKNIIQKID